jgi:Fe-S-cluster containining protein
MYLERDLSKIRQLAARREDENYRFRKFLKCRDRKKTDNIVHRLHAQITPLIDCTSCGNCCRFLTPKLSAEDINVLAQMENISPDDYKAAYCEEDFGNVYLNDLPCRYLDGNKCGIYENRPMQCKTFPNTNKPDFTSRLLGMISFYEICPIVFNIMEKLKDELRFSR